MQLKNGRNLWPFFMMLLPVGKKNDSVVKTYLMGRIRTFYGLLDHKE